MPTTSKHRKQITRKESERRNLSPVGTNEPCGNEDHIDLQILIGKIYAWMRVRGKGWNSRLEFVSYDSLTSPSDSERFPRSFSALLFHSASEDVSIS